MEHRQEFDMLKLQIGLDKPLLVHAVVLMNLKIGWKHNVQGSISYLKNKLRKLVIGHILVNPKMLLNASVNKTKTKIFGMKL